MLPSLAKRIRDSQSKFTLFHTSSVTEDTLNKAINTDKSIDIDIAVNVDWTPFIGHSLEYYRISGEDRPTCMSFESALSQISVSHIPVILDCKELGAWSYILDALERIGPHRCMVHIYPTELRFSHFEWADYDYPSEWIPIGYLRALKEKFPNVTTTVSCKYLPPDTLKNSDHREKLIYIKTLLQEHHIDSLCLNVLDNTMDDATIDFFHDAGIILHVNIDTKDVGTLHGVYIWETDILAHSSDAKKLWYGN